MLCCIAFLECQYPFRVSRLSQKAPWAKLDLTILFDSLPEVAHISHDMAFSESNFPSITSWQVKVHRSLLNKAIHNWSDATLCIVKQHMRYVVQRLLGYSSLFFQGKILPGDLMFRSIISPISVRESLWWFSLLEWGSSLAAGPISPFHGSILSLNGADDPQPSIVTFFLASVLVVQTASLEIFSMALWTLSSVEPL